MVSVALAFILAVVPITQEYGCSITSYFRTPQRNELVGGVENSKHLKAEAIDCVLDDRNLNVDLYLAVTEMGYDMIVYPTHIHIETRN